MKTMKAIVRSLTFFPMLASLLGLLGIAGPFSSSLGAAELVQQTEAVKLTPWDDAIFSQFGYAVAADATILAVAAINDGDNGFGAGAVYLFERQEEGEPDEWLQVLKLTGSDTAANDGFGSSVALDEDTLFVGAVRHVSGGVRSGAVYVFERDAGGPEAWGEVAKLVPSIAGDFDLFGMEVAVDDDVLVVGASQALDSLGAVYVFERHSSHAPTWEESAILSAPGPQLLSSFGFAVAVDDDRILVGAAGEHIDNDTRGAAYLFEPEDRGGGGWALVQRLVASDDPALGFFGVSVALEDDLLVSGAYGANFACPSTLFCFSGSVYTFHRDESGFWSAEPKLIPSDNGPGHSFGISLSMEEDRLLVGAMWSNSTCTLGTCRFPGAAYLFERDSFAEGRWSELIKFIPSDAGDRALHGFSTALSGDLAVAGAHDAEGTGTASGAAYLYALPTTVQVSIDVLPGSTRNPLHVKSEGLIPVAILTTRVVDGEDADFNALDVDAHTVRFGPDEAEIAHRRAHAEDVDADGDFDLLMHFAAQEAEFVCEDTSASLSGETFDGEEVSGEDHITLVGCRRNSPASRGRAGGGPITNSAAQGGPN